MRTNIIFCTVCRAAVSLAPKNRIDFLSDLRAARESVVSVVAAYRQDIIFIFCIEYRVAVSLAPQKTVSTSYQTCELHY